MAGFADLVNQGQPAIYGGGVSAAGTAGQTWRWTWTDVVDNTGALIDLTTGVTATCAIYYNGTELTTLTVTLGNGTFAIGKDKASTASLANADIPGRACTWKLELDNGTESVMVWKPDNSRFLIYAETGL